MHINLCPPPPTAKVMRLSEAFLANGASLVLIYNGMNNCKPVKDMSVLFNGLYGLFPLHISIAIGNTFHGDYLDWLDKLMCCPRYVYLGR